MAAMRHRYANGGLFELNPVTNITGHLFSRQKVSQSVKTVRHHLLVLFPPASI